METTVAAVYCEGWNGALVNPLTADRAESRDSAGEPYTVVLLAGGRPHFVLDISWAEGYVGVTRLGTGGRTIATHELRRAPEGDLFLRVTTTSDGPSRHRTTWQIGGLRIDSIESTGARGGPHTLSDLGRTPPRLPIPAFGRWKALLDRTGRVHAEICTGPYREECTVPVETDGPFQIVDDGYHVLPVSASGERPWHPPRPKRPRGLDTLFRNGAEGSADGRRMSISTFPAGKLNLPSGRLVAADPTRFDRDPESFRTTVTPGTYPVTVSLASFTDDPEHRFVAAVRLDVADRRPVTWEMALRDGQDPFDLGYGEFFGFTVETGIACFVDEDHLGRISSEGTDLELTRERFTNQADGDLIAWSSGWGDGYYPTWIGRDHSGRVVTFVADMLLFDQEG